MELLIEASENFTSNLSPIQVNGPNVRFVRTAKSLSIPLNRELNWLNHVKMNCG